MKARKVLMLMFFFQFARIVSAEIIEIRNDVLFRKSYDLTEQTVFRIETSNGEIQLLPAEDGLFTIEASASGFRDIAKVDIVGPLEGKFKFQLMNSQSGGNVSIGNICIGGAVFINGVRVNGSSSGMSAFSCPQLDVTLRVPAEFLSHVQLKTSNGKIVASGFSESVSGRLIKLITNNSSVEIDNLGTADNGEISVSTSNGSIYAGGCKGTLTLDTSNGNVTAENSEGNIWIKTSNANVSVTGHSGGSVSAKSSNGNINFNNPDAISEDGTTSNGKVNYTRRVNSSRVSRSGASSQVFNF